jgi:predicted branched-subunit amino acid permease/AraC-like DNA-binding protein
VLAAAVEASPFSLLRAFRAETGLPPHAYVNQRRVRLARDLLTQGVAPADVAARVGFADQAHLTISSGSSACRRGRFSAGARTFKTARRALPKLCRMLSPRRARMRKARSLRAGQDTQIAYDPVTDTVTDTATGTAGGPRPQRGPAAPAAGEPGPGAPVAGDARSRERARRDGLSLGFAVGFSGIAFGAAAVTAGLSVPQACALSLLAFTGASQYALAVAVAGGGSLIAGTLGALLLGSRNALYGLRLADVLRVRGRRRLLTAHAVIDETTAMALAQPGLAAARAGFAATFAALYTVWNAATLAGALGAGRIGSPGEFGLDVIGPAAFLALLWPRLCAGPAERRVAALGAAVAIGGTPFLPVGIPVMLAATAVAAGVRR